MEFTSSVVYLHHLWISKAGGAGGGRDHWNLLPKLIRGVVTSNPRALDTSKIRIECSH